MAPLCHKGKTPDGGCHQQHQICLANSLVKSVNPAILPDFCYDPASILQDDEKLCPDCHFLLGYFCSVVDNYGRYWRKPGGFARQLANEYQLPVRLWIDDLASFQRLYSQLDTTLSEQTIDNVLIGHWNPNFPANVPRPSGD